MLSPIARVPYACMGTEELAETLRVNGINALGYHAGMDAGTRVKHQDAFLMEEVDVVFHLAGQVAVTTSYKFPKEDFDANALGTFNVLEAIRRSERKPMIIYASTNKVYGGMSDIEQQQVVSDFGNESTPLRILVASDVASEGINLHFQSIFIEY